MVTDAIEKEWSKFGNHLNLFPTCKQSFTWARNYSFSGPEGGDI